MSLLSVGSSESEATLQVVNNATDSNNILFNYCSEKLRFILTENEKKFFRLSSLKLGSITSSLSKNLKYADEVTACIENYLDSTDTLNIKFMMHIIDAIDFQCNGNAAEAMSYQISDNLRLILRNYFFEIKLKTKKKDEQESFMKEQIEKYQGKQSKYYGMKTFYNRAKYIADGVNQFLNSESLYTNYKLLQMSSNNTENNRVAFLRENLPVCEPHRIQSNERRVGNQEVVVESKYVDDAQDDFSDTGLFLISQQEAVDNSRPYITFNKNQHKHNDYIRHIHDYVIKIGEHLNMRTGTVGGGEGCDGSINQVSFSIFVSHAQNIPVGYSGVDFGSGDGRVALTIAASTDCSMYAVEYHKPRHVLSYHTQERLLKHSENYICSTSNTKIDDHTEGNRNFKNAQFISNHEKATVPEILINDKKNIVLAYFFSLGWNSSNIEDVVKFISSLENLLIFFTDIELTKLYEYGFLTMNLNEVEIFNVHNCKLYKSASSRQCYVYKFKRAIPTQVSSFKVATMKDLKNLSAADAVIVREMKNERSIIAKINYNNNNNSSSSSSNPSQAYKDKQPYEPEDFRKDVRPKHKKIKITPSDDDIFEAGAICQKLELSGIKLPPSLKTANDKVKYVSENKVKLQNDLLVSAKKMVTSQTSAKLQNSNVTLSDKDTFEAGAICQKLELSGIKLPPALETIEDKVKYVIKNKVSLQKRISTKKAHASQSESFMNLTTKHLSNMLPNERNDFINKMISTFKKDEPLTSSTSGMPVTDNMEEEEEEDTNDSNGNRCIPVSDDMEEEEEDANDSNGNRCIPVSDDTMEEEEEEDNHSSRSNGNKNVITASSDHVKQSETMTHILWAPSNPDSTNCSELFVIGIPKTLLVSENFQHLNNLQSATVFFEKKLVLMMRTSKNVENNTPKCSSPYSFLHQVSTGSTKIKNWYKKNLKAKAVPHSNLTKFIEGLFKSTKQGSDVHKVLLNYREFADKPNATVDFNALPSNCRLDVKFFGQLDLIRKLKWKVSIFTKPLSIANKLPNHVVLQHIFPTSGVNQNHDNDSEQIGVATFHYSDLLNTLNGELGHYINDHLYLATQTVDVREKQITEFKNLFQWLVKEAMSICKNNANSNDEVRVSDASDDDDDDESRSHDCGDNNSSNQSDDDDESRSDDCGDNNSDKNSQEEEDGNSKSDKNAITAINYGGDTNNDDTHFTPLDKPNNDEITEEDWISAAEVLEEEKVPDIRTAVVTSRCEISDSPASKDLMVHKKFFEGFVIEYSKKNKQSKLATFENIVLNTKGKEWNMISNDVWINDSLIDSWAALMKLQNPEAMQNVYVQNTSFYPAFLQNSSANLKKWAKKLDKEALEKIEYFIFPINHNNSHWIFYIVEVKTKIVRLYDSISDKNEDHYKYFLGITSWVYQLYEDAKVKDKYSPFPPESLAKCKHGYYQVEWLEKEITTKYIPLTEYYAQNNGYDCGICVCRAVEIFLKSKNKSFIINFPSTPTVKDYRNRIRDFINLMKTGGIDCM